MPAKKIPILFTVVLITILFVQCKSKSAYHYPSDLEQGLINGPVTHLITLKYETDSAGKEQLTEKTIELFNEHGSSPSDTIHYLLNNEEEVNVLYFNANNSVREKITSVNGKKTAIMRGKYDEDGKMIRLDLLDGVDSLQEYYRITELSESGEPQAAEHHNAQGQLLDSFRNVYDNFTRVSAINMDASGNIIYRETVETNDKKRPVKVIGSTLHENKMITDTTLIKYDSLDHYGNWRIQYRTVNSNKQVKYVRILTYRS